MCFSFAIAKRLWHFRNLFACITKYMRSNKVVEIIRFQFRQEWRDMSPNGWDFVSGWLFYSLRARNVSLWPGTYMVFFFQTIKSNQFHIIDMPADAICIAVCRRESVSIGMLRIWKKKQWKIFKANWPKSNITNHTNNFNSECLVHNILPIITCEDELTHAHTHTTSDILNANLLFFYILLAQCGTLHQHTIYANRYFEIMIYAFRIMAAAAALANNAG